MGRRSKNNLGFTLLELMVSMAVGLFVIATALQLYSQALKATWIASQKAEMQQDFRSSANLMTRDISMAGAGSISSQGLATSAVELPQGTGILPVYPCSASTCNYIGGAPVTYPAASSGARYLYSIIPGYDVGITVNAASGPTDIITVVYADPNLASSCYTFTMTSTNPPTVKFQLPAVVSPATLPPNCVVQTGLTAPQALNDPVVGLQAGDVVMFDQSAIGVVSAIATCSPTGTNTACYTVTFANGDPGHINQSAATAGDLANYTPSATSTATRLLVITYYLDISPIDGVTPRLMRLQNGKAPAPVAENVTYLKFSYDVYNNGTITANQPSLPAGTNPSMITKVNIVHMAIRSQLPGITGYQGLDLQTSISARDMTFKNEYPIN